MFGSNAGLTECSGPRQIKRYPLLNAKQSCCVMRLNGWVTLCLALVLAGCQAPKDTTHYAVSISATNAAEALPWAKVRDSHAKEIVTEAMGDAAVVDLSQSDFNTLLDDLSSAYSTHFGTPLTMPAPVLNDGSTWMLNLQADTR